MSSKAVFALDPCCSKVIPNAQTSSYPTVRMITFLSNASSYRTIIGKYGSNKRAKIVTDSSLRSFRGVQILVSSKLFCT